MVCVVTNRKLIINNNLENVLENCLKNGADCIILREKDLQYEELLYMAQEIKKITDRYSVPLIINGNIDIAEKIKAYGFHTGFEDFMKIIYSGDLKLKHKFLKVGVSIHGVHEAVIVNELGADYVIAGHIFNTECKRDMTGRGIEFIKEISKKISIPVIAIGGIKPSNAKIVISSGAKGVAVMSSAMESIDGQIIKELLEET